jgi:hypothetical protein
MKYIVTLGWRCQFEFEEGKTAIDFATIALAHMSGENDDKGVSIAVVEEGEDDE